MEEGKTFLKIIRSFVKEEELVLGENLDEEKLYNLAFRHKMSNFLINWSKRNARSDKIKNRINADFSSQIIRDTNERIELEKILNNLEENNIETLVVKGILMKDIYPQNYMRQMCDFDIMVHLKDFKKSSKIFEKMGYEKYRDLEKHLVFEKEPFINVELHRKLLLEKNLGHEYFDDIWSAVVPYKNYKNVVMLNVDDNYIFCIFHLLNHFKNGGINVRDILDVYLYNEKYKEKLNQDKIKSVFERFDVQNFEENIRKIAYRWFGDGEIDDFDEVEKFIFRGFNKNTILNYGIHDEGGKGMYLIHLIFPKYKFMKNEYPILQKLPVLLPATWMTRLLKDLFSKATSVRVRLDTVKALKKVKQEDVEDTERIYKKLGIIK